MLFVKNCTRYKYKVQNKANKKVPGFHVVVVLIVPIGYMYYQVMYPGTRNFAPAAKL